VCEEELAACKAELAECKAKNAVLLDRLQRRVKEIRDHWVPEVSRLRQNWLAAEFSDSDSDFVAEVSRQDEEDEANAAMSVNSIYRSR
jgi:hypothetical protein